jgi:hypothetical protein
MFDKYLVKKGERVAAASAPMAFDGEDWNSGTYDNPHPLK